MRLYGKNPVLERLKANPKSIRKIFVEEGHGDAGYVRKKAAQWNIGFCQIPAMKMLKLTHDIHSQGILADVEDFQYKPYEDLLEEAVAQNASLVFLDGLKDPQNLGAIMRSLACLGRFAIVLPRKDSVDVTDSTNGFRAIRLAIFKDERIDIHQSWLDHYELEPYILFKAITLGYRLKEVFVIKKYPPKKLGYTKMKPIVGWWSILKPVLYLGLRIRR